MRATFWTPPIACRYLSSTRSTDGTFCACASTSSASSLGGPYTTSIVIVVTGRSRPRWQVQQVTTCRPLKSTRSVPADGWQPTQSEPTAADMMPMVSRKSSTPMPLSAWTFLNTSSAIIGFACGGVWPPSAVSVASMTASAAAIAYVDPSFIYGGPPDGAGAFDRPPRLRPGTTS